MSWCTQWMGTLQDCIDHIRQKHNVGDSVKMANHLAKWFPPWTVKRAAWHTALKPKVSGVSTDVALFSEQGAQLVHHYRMFGDCATHASLWGSFMVDLLYFTNQACADHPVRKAPQAESPVVAVLLPLPLFATQSVMPDIGHSSSVATQKYSSWPGSRSSTPCLDLAIFDFESSGSVSLDSPVSAVVMDRDVVEPPELSEVNVLGIATTTSRFSLFNPRRSPVLSIPQIVVEQPMSYEAPVGFKDECPTADLAGPLPPQEFQVSSVQLSPNQVREDYDFDTMDGFPMYVVSPRNEGYFPSVSPISS